MRVHKMFISQNSYKCSNFVITETQQPNCTDNLHVDATIMCSCSRSYFKEQIEDKTTSLLVQIDNRIRILVMLQIMMLNISSPVYVITKISAIISRYLTAKFEQ